jgi:hypothetical protein
MKRDKFEWYIQINTHMHTRIYIIYILSLLGLSCHISHLYLDGNTPFHHVCLGLTWNQNKLFVDECKLGIWDPSRCNHYLISTEGIGYLN